MRSKGITVFAMLALSWFTAQEARPVELQIDSVIIKHSGNSAAQDSVLRADSFTENTVYPKEFRKDFRKSYDGPDFNYSTIKPRESIWQQFLKKVSDFLTYLFGEMNPGKAMGITEIIIRIFAIALVAFLLYFLLRFLYSKYGVFFRKKNAQVVINGTEIHENIHEINFEETIRGFEHKRDFRSAVRYRFLLVLKNMTDTNKIHWNPEKTNRDYISEISLSQLRQDFTELVYIFDNVWYGEFPIDEPNYNQFKAKFNAIITK